MLQALPLPACAVCASADPTLSAPGGEQPFEGRLRLDLTGLVGGVGVAAPDGRPLSLVDARLAATASYAPTASVLASVVLPALHRTLSDGALRTSSEVPGDVELDVVDTAWRGTAGGWTRAVELLGGVALPTAPVGYDARSAPLPSTLQPGCSALAPHAGIAYSLRSGWLSARGSAVVYLPFSVRTAPHPGDSLRAGAWLQAQASPRFAARLGLRARIDGTGELAPGVPDLNSGGFIGYVTSELVVSPLQDLIVSMGASFPAVQVLLGQHRETAVAGAAIGYDF